jgi:hypothetical protein
MDKNSKATKLRWVIVLSIMMLVTGCSAKFEKGRKPSDDLSRGLPLGEDASSTVALAVNPDGTNIHAVWPYQTDTGTTSLRYVKLSQDAEFIIDRDVLDFSGRARTPQILLAGNNHLQLIWVERADENSNWVLWYVELDDHGNLQNEPVRISDPASGVGSYVASPEGENGTLVIWEDKATNGLNWVQISAGAGGITSPEILVQEGNKPSMRMDNQGNYHIIWMMDEYLFYDQFLLGDSKPLDGTEIARISVGTGARLDQPAIGLSDGWVYVFWSILKQSGLEAGTASTEYISFPVGSPLEKPTTRIGISPLEEQPFQPYLGIFTLSQFVRAIDPIRSVAYVYEPVAAQAYQPELAIAVATKQLNRLDLYDQIAICLLEGGQLKGYTFGTKTLEISGDVAITSDSNGNLHLVWRDGFTGSRVYYATTAARTREIIDRLDVSDLPRLLLNGGLEGITGILLFPFAFPWIAIGLILLVVWRLIRNDENLDNKVSRLLMVLSVISYHGSKFLFMPTIIDYVPFSAWIDVPSDRQLALRIGVPLIIFAIAMMIAELIRRKLGPSTIRYYLAIVLVDVVLTLAIYGVNFMGAY